MVCSVTLYENQTMHQFLARPQARRCPIARPSGLPRAWPLCVRTLNPVPLAFAALLACVNLDSAAQPAAASPAAAASSAERVEIKGSSSTVETNTLTGLQSVMGRAEIERFGDARLEETLRRLPGVTVENPSGRAPEVRLRGLGTGYVRITINGEATPPGFSIESIAASQVERIEVSRSVTADSSGQAIAGTINIVLRTAGTAPERSLQLSAGDARGLPSAGLDALYSDKARGQTGEWRRSVAASLQRDLTRANSHFEQSLRPLAANPDVQRAAESALSSQTLDQAIRGFSTTMSIGAGLQFKPSKGWAWGLDATARRRTIEGMVTEDRSSSGPDLVPSLVSDRPVTLFTTSSAQIKAKGQRNFDEGSKLETSLSISTNRRSLDVQIAGVDSTGATALSQHTRVDTLVRSGNSSGKYSLSIGESDRLSVGWDAEQARALDTQIQTDTVPFQGLFGTVRDTYSAQVRNLAFFAQGEVTLANALSGYAGVRWQTLRSTVQGSATLPSGLAESVLPAVQRRDSVVSPIARVTWGEDGNDAKGQSSYSASIGRAFRAPITRDLIPRRQVGSINGPTTPDEVGNPFLHPELAWGLDLSNQRTIAGFGGLSLNLFGRVIKDTILREDVFESGRWVERKANSGNARVWGLEVDARLDGKQLDPAASDYAINAYLGLNRSRLLDVAIGTKTLDLQAPVLLRISWEYRPASNSGAVATNIPAGNASTDSALSRLWSPGAWKFGGQYQFLGASRSRRSDVVDSTQASYSTVDLYAVLQANKDSTLRISVTNLLATKRVSGIEFRSADSLLAESRTDAGYAAVKLIFRTAFR